MATAKAPADGWVGLYGEFDFRDGTVRFKGGPVPVPAEGTPVSTPKVQPSFGLALNSRAIADGDVSADICFEDEVTAESVCELAVAYDANASHLATAGLGGGGFALVSIREFGGPKSSGSWWNHRVAGERANMKPGVTHHLHAKFRGATLTLSVDDVPVGSAEVASPMGRPRQVGLFCRGFHPITISNFKVEGTKPKAFVVMQFGAEFDAVYQDVIAEVLKDYEANVLRADEMTGTGLIISDIVREINEAQLIIADITPTNANVYFEVGYALALNKPAILLARKGTALPFDVAGFRVLFYENTIGGKGRLEGDLRRHLDAILQK